MDTNAIAVQFWNDVSVIWDKIYPQIFGDSGSDVLNYLQSLLPESISDKIELEILFGEMNKLALPAFKDEVELYISPRNQIDNIPIMNALYKEYKQLPHLHVCKYKPYHPKDPLILDINFGAFKAKYSDFGVQVSYGFSEQKKPVLNLVIMVKQPLASKILEKRQMWFKNPKTQQNTSRNLWISRKSNALDLFLLNVLGEYNLIHHVGYIEILPSDDDLITEQSVFTELSDMKNSIELITKQYNYNTCNYCQHIELQTNIKRCSTCKTISYCSKVCQVADWKCHKIVCKKIIDV